MKLYIKLLCILSFSFTVNPCISWADINTDTVKLKAMPDDTAKANLLIKTSEDLRDYNTDLGIKYGQSALDLSVKLQFKHGIAAANKAIGLNYWRIGVYNTALDYFLKALDLFRELKDKYSICKSYNNIGLIYYARTQPDKAKEYYEKGLKIAYELDNKSEISRILHNEGLLEYEHGSVTTALELHRKSLENAGITNETKLIAYNHCFIGKCFTRLNKLDSAQIHLEKSLDMFNKMGLTNLIAMVNNTYANFYLVSKQYSKAIEFANKASKLGGAVGNNYMRMESLDLLYNAYKEQKKYKEAMEYLFEYHKLSDTMKNESNIESIAHLEEKFNFDRKLKDLQIEKEREIYKNQIIAKAAGASAVFLLIVVVVVALFYKWKAKTNLTLIRRNLEISLLNDKLQESNNTKDKFFSIIAHDLRNPLGTFRDSTKMIVNKENSFTPEESADLLEMIAISADNIYLLLENLLEWSRSQRGTISFNPADLMLIMIVNNAISALKPSADEKKIQINHTVYPTQIVYADANMLNTIIRNLVSNAIKFTTTGGAIEIGIMDTNNSEVVVFVKDSGMGMSGSTLNKLFKIAENVTALGTSGEKGTGLGLILCKEFVDKHGGKIWVESEEGNGSTFYFSLPKI